MGGGGGVLHFTRTLSCGHFTFFFFFNFNHQSNLNDPEIHLYLHQINVFRLSGDYVLTIMISISGFVKINTAKSRGNIEDDGISKISCPFFQVLFENISSFSLYSPGFVEII